MNCLSPGDSCNGGQPADVYEFAFEKGIPHDSCQTYLAANPADATCGGKFYCEDCMGPPGAGDKNCFERKNPTVVYAKDQGEVAGADHMKQEIQQNGPIACGISANENLENYTGGVLSDPSDSNINHVVSVVGWGVTDDNLE